MDFVLMLVLGTIVVWLLSGFGSHHHFGGKE